MTIPTSSIPAVREYLLTQMQALLTADSSDPSLELLVCLDEPGTYQPFDIVYIGDVHQNYSPESSVGSGGAYWLREDYTVQIVVSVYRAGDPTGDTLARTTFNRARTLADQIINMVRGDPSLGHLVDRARPSVVTHQSQWEDDHSGRRAEIDISIDCMNTL